MKDLFINYLIYEKEMRFQPFIIPHLSIDENDIDERGLI